MSTTRRIEAVTRDLAANLPFRCSKCGSFVGQERGHEADDYLPAKCKRCTTNHENQTREVQGNA